MQILGDTGGYIYILHLILMHLIQKVFWFSYKVIWKGCILHRQVLGVYVCRGDIL